MDWLYRIAEMHLFAKLWDFIVLIPVLVAFHYCMYHTKVSYKNSKLISEWLGIGLILVIAVGITFYYS